MRRVLSDGTQVVVRPIRAEDKADLASGLRRLSDRSVQRRFLTPKHHFSAAELRYFTEVDGHDHVAFVAELPERPGRLVAVARYVRLVDEPDTAEAAIVVADPLQGRGLGTVLADELAHEALRQDVRRFTATMLSENRAAHRLMSRLSQHLERRHDGSGLQEIVADLAA